MERQIMQFYEVDIMINGKMHDVSVALDGTIMAIETQVDESDIPDGVKRGIDDLPNGAKFEEINQIEMLAEWRMIPLSKPTITFEVDYQINGAVQEMRIDAKFKR